LIIIVNSISLKAVSDTCEYHLAIKTSY